MTIVLKDFSILQTFNFYCTFPVQLKSLIDQQPAGTNVEHSCLI